MDALVKNNLQRELTRQLGDMELATQLTTMAMEEVGNIHRYAADKVAETLKDAQQKIDAAVCDGSLTGEKEYRVKVLTQTYLSDMLYITHHGSMQMTRLLMNCATRR